MRLILDYEARSHADITDVGVWRYSADPTTQPLCVAFATRDDRPGSPWSRVGLTIFEGGAEGRAAVEARVARMAPEVIVVPKHVFLSCMRDATTLVAHNFEMENAFTICQFPEIQLAGKVWSCTAARSRQLSLPGSLELAPVALGFEHRKDKDGSKVLSQVSRPRAAWKENRSGRQYFDDAERLARTGVYCARDIFAETGLDDYLPELCENEHRIWEQMNRVNRRGVRIDVDLLQAMEVICAQELVDITQGVISLTSGQVQTLNQIAEIQLFCSNYGVRLPSLTAQIVNETLDRKDLPGPVRTILEARQAVGRASTAKLVALRARLMADNRARDMNIYHGAHTGRTTGSGVNPLNLPRPYDKMDHEGCINALLSRDMAAVKAQHKNPMTVVACNLRGLFISSVGKSLIVGDYSGIELSILFTLAGQWDLIAKIKNKVRIYSEMASIIYGRPIDKKLDPIEDYTGKQTVLGMGYGMSWSKFVSHCRSLGFIITDDLGQRAHRSYRTMATEVPKLWNGVEAAAVSAVQYPGRTFQFRDLQFSCDGYWLVMILPNGSLMHYPNVRLMEGKYDKLSIVYDHRVKGAWTSVNTWGGTLVENACQKITREILGEHEVIIEEQLGVDVLCTTYDEIMGEVDTAVAEEKLDAMLGVMRTLPAWFPNMALDAAGFVAPRYRKD